GAMQPQIRLGRIFGIEIGLQLRATVSLPEFPPKRVGKAEHHSSQCQVELSLNVKMRSILASLLAILFVTGTIYGQQPVTSSSRCMCPRRLIPYSYPYSYFSYGYPYRLHNRSLYSLTRSMERYHENRH